METGRLLIRTGRLEHARAFLEQAEPRDEQERVERLFLLGQIALRLGIPEKAVERFEAILALRPGLTRVRLELARAYYLAGLDDKAREHLNRSLGDELPSSVEAAVEDFLRRIDARKRWSVFVSAAALPETRRPERESVLIGGVPFRLDEEATAPSGAGALVSGGVSFSPEVGERTRGVFAASAAAKVYERSNWNEANVSGELGMTRLFDRGSVSGGVRIGRVWTGGDPERVSHGPWIRIGWRVSGSTRVDVTGNADHRQHDARDARDGWRLTAAPRLVHVLDGQTSLEVEPVLETVTANERHHASRLVGLGASVSRAFERDLSVSLSASAQVEAPCSPRPALRNEKGRPDASRFHASAPPVVSVPRVRAVHRLLAGTDPLEHPDSRVPDPGTRGGCLACLLSPQTANPKPFNHTKRTDSMLSLTALRVTGGGL